MSYPLCLTFVSIYVSSAMCIEAVYARGDESNAERLRSLTSNGQYINMYI